jgi:transcriptional regulator GlxA family with amidase domain
MALIGFSSVGMAQISNASVPVKFGMVVFPAITPLDLFGPLNVFNEFSLTQHMDLSIIALTLDPVTTKLRNHQQANSSFSQSIVPTHTFANPPQDLDVLFVPGGVGTRAVLSPYPELRLTELIAYIAKVYPSLKYLVTICTGSQLAAQAGVLDGRNATTNKSMWAQTVVLGPKTYWHAKARWVRDGNIYSTSGVTAGIDGTLQFVEDIWGKQQADDLADGLEHRRTTDPSDDPFADIYGAEDVPPVDT